MACHGLSHPAMGRATPPWSRNTSPWRAAAAPRRAASSGPRPLGPPHPRTRQTLKASRTPCTGLPAAWPPVPGPLSQDSHHSFDMGREICSPQHSYSTTAPQTRSTHLMKSKAEKLSQQPSWFPRGTKKKEVEGELRTAAVAQERGSEIGGRIAALGKGPWWMEQGWSWREGLHVRGRQAWPTEKLLEFQLGWVSAEYGGRGGERVVLDNLGVQLASLPVLPSPNPVRLCLKAVYPYTSSQHPVLLGKGKGLKARWAPHNPGQLLLECNSYLVLYSHRVALVHRSDSGAQVSGVHPTYQDTWEILEVLSFRLLIQGPRLGGGGTKRKQGTLRGGGEPGEAMGAHKAL